MRLNQAASSLLILRIRIAGCRYEVTHSQEILADLLKTFIEEFKPLMTFFKPERDTGLVLGVQNFPNYE